MLRVGYICPVYAAAALHDYTEGALRSFYETTPGGEAIVVDDGSSSWDRGYEQQLQALAAEYDAPLYLYHFPRRGGLTRSWNKGLELAVKSRMDYAIAGNNDILFTAKWYEGLLHALNSGYAMAGPLSNAPGITAKGAQEVVRWVPKFRLTDDRDTLDRIAAVLHRERLGMVVESPVNGFFQMASVESWVDGMYSKNAFYRPHNARMSNGRRNPTPLMTLNEDELQARWSRMGMKSAIALSSYIFHYRAVSRGDKYKRGYWYRKK